MRHEEHSADEEEVVHKPQQHVVVDQIRQPTPLHSYEAVEMHQVV